MAELHPIEVILIWYASGLFAQTVNVIYRNYFTKDEIVLTIESLANMFSIALLGFVLYLVPIFIFLLELYRNYDKIKAKVVWKNRRAKNKDILFGDNNE